jgi:hypothetical protein
MTSTPRSTVMGFKSKSDFFQRDAVACARQLNFLWRGIVYLSGPESGKHAA